MTLEAAIKWLDSTDDYAWPVVKEYLKKHLAIEEKIDG